MDSPYLSATVPFAIPFNRPTGKPKPRGRPNRGVPPHDSDSDSGSGSGSGELAYSQSRAGSIGSVGSRDRRVHSQSRASSMGSVGSRNGSWSDFRPGSPASFHEMLSSRSDQPQTSHDWLTGDDNVLDPIVKASTGSPQPNKSTHDAPHVGLNKEERAAMVAALMSSFRRSIDSAKNPVRKSTVASWVQRRTVSPTRNAPPPTTNLTNFGVALPPMARRMNRNGSPVHRRSNTESILSQNGLPPPSLPPMHTQEQRGKPPSRAKRTVPPSSTGNWNPVEPLLPPPAQSTFWDAPTGADSSESKGGPEDVQSSTAQHMRWREQDKKFQSGSGNLEAPTMHSEQRSRSAEPSRTSAENAYTRAVHLFPPVGTVERRHSPSSGSGLERDTNVPRPQVPQKRFLASDGQPTYLRDSPLDSPPVPSPSNDSRAPLNRLRRGSISDMLSRYEAVLVMSSTTSGYTSLNEDGPTSRKPKPAIPTKPAALRSPMRKSIAPQPGNASIVSPIDSSALQQDQAKINSSVKMQASLKLLAPTDSPTETSQTYNSASRESGQDKRLSTTDPHKGPRPTDWMLVDETLTSRAERDARFMQIVAEGLAPGRTKAGWTQARRPGKRDRDAARAKLREMEEEKEGERLRQLLGEDARPSASAATSQGPLQRLHLPIMDTGRSVSPGSQTGSVSDTHEHILLVSPQPRKLHDAFNNHPDPTLVQATTPTISQSSSLEQPFKGVGKLIEQWQKKTEEAEQVGVKPTGPQRLRRPPVKLTAAS